MDKNKKDIQMVLLSIPDMSCTHCVNSISKTLRLIKGIEKFKVSLKRKTIGIVYDNNAILLEDIQSQLKEKGYISQETI